MEPESSTGTEECTDTDTCTGSADGLRTEGDEISGLGQVNGTVKDDIFDSVDLFKPTAKTVTAADLAGKTKVLLFFRTTCYYSQTSIDNLVASSINAVPYIQVILFAQPDIDAASTEQARVTDDFINAHKLAGYAITNHDFDGTYTKYLNRYANAIGFTVDYFPMLVIVDGDNNIKYCSTKIQPVETFLKALDYAKASSNYKAVQSVSVASAELNPLKVGQTVSMGASIASADASNSRIRYTSSNTSVANVSDDGTITGTGIGTAVITATSMENSEIQVLANLVLVNR